MGMIEYAAFGGLERIVIIAGALVVGYWGYRLYTRDKSAGLIFLGIACAVLLGTLFTGGSHVRAVGETVQLASGAEPQTPSAADSTAPDNTVASAAQADEHSAFADATAAKPAAAQTEAAALTAAQESPQNDSDVVDATQSMAPEADAVDAAAPEVQDIARAQELGGRIVSVKSKSVSLEWTRPDKPGE